MASTRFRGAGQGRELLFACAGMLTVLLVLLYWHALSSTGIPSDGVVGDPSIGAFVPTGSYDVGVEQDVELAAGDALTVARQEGEVEYVVTGTLSDAAQGLVGQYRQEPCLVRHAAYLDLFGNVWGCVLEGPGWIDSCVVRERELEGTSIVRIVRTEVPRGEAAHAALGER